MGRLSPEEPSHPMLQITRSMGSIEKGIQTLEDKQSEIAEGQREVEEKISGLYQTVAGLVTQNECYQRRTDLETVIKGGTYPEVRAVKRPPAKKTGLGRLAEHAGDITKILGLLGIIGASLWAVHGFLARVERALETSGKKQRTATQELIRRLDDPPKPKIIYVQVEPDAGKRRRRVRRRPRPRPRPKDAR